MKKFTKGILVLRQTHKSGPRRASKKQEQHHRQQQEEEEGAEEEQDKYCEFCGKMLTDSRLSLFGSSKKRKYCSKQCQQTASRRRASARLGIPSRTASKLNPLYFD